MCGIRFNHEKFAHQCYHCGKLALQAELFFFQQQGVWLCEECLEKEQEMKEENNKKKVEKV